VLDTVAPARFEHVAERDQVRLQVAARRDQRMAHAGLRRQVHHQGRAHPGEQRRHLHRIGQFGRAARHLQRPEQRAHAANLQARIIVIVEIVAAGDLVPEPGQPRGHEAADEAGRASHQYRLFSRCHDCVFPRRWRR
jgi:hypothetical protein